ncbi:MAG: hypothetical protein HZB98_13145, partial [Bacteroidia bacterium]|nr:hypothetical protein [Bacteroidia bacterium]
NQFQFNGYTNYWHNIFRDQIRYGNLFKLSLPKLDYTIAQARTDMATEFGIPGLAMQEGFMNSILKEQYTTLDQPSLQKINETIATGNVLAIVDPSTEAGKKLTEKLPSDYIWKDKLKSYQYGAKDFSDVLVFTLESGNKKIFVVASTSKDMRDKTLALMEATKGLLAKFDIHKGWFGAETLLKSVTCTPGHPLEVIGKGMNEGNSWFTFTGYMDFLAQKEMAEWLSKINNPAVADYGFGQIHGLKDYDGLQVQSMFTPDAWIKYAHEKEGYVFRQVWDASGESDKYQYDGYFATEGQKDQIDNDNVPFVLNTGSLYGGTENSMVLFTPKGSELSKKLIWEAIMDRREVAVFKGGMMMGPALYRNSLQLLLIDRVWLEEYFGDRIDLDASTKDYKLILNITNSYNKAVSGSLNIVLPPELKMDGGTTTQVNLPANSTKTLEFNLNPQASALRKTNPIALHFKWGEQKKSTLAILDLPRAISVHQLLYGHAPKVTFPVAIHNFTDKQSFPVKLEVV